jgi:cysteine-rich repeat protein
MLRRRCGGAGASLTPSPETGRRAGCGAARAGARSWCSPPLPAAAREALPPRTKGSPRRCRRSAQLQSHCLRQRGADGCPACDDGNAVSGDGCDPNCTVTGCGDGVLTSGEACDDGNLANGDGCSATCQSEGQRGGGRHRRRGGWGHGRSKRRRLRRGRRRPRGRVQLRHRGRRRSPQPLGVGARVRGTRPRAATASSDVSTVAPWSACCTTPGRARGRWCKVRVVRGRAAPRTCRTADRGFLRRAWRRRRPASWAGRSSGSRPWRRFRLRAQSPPPA